MKRSTLALILIVSIAVVLINGLMIWERNRMDTGTTMGLDTASLRPWIGSDTINPGLIRIDTNGRAEYWAVQISDTAGNFAAGKKCDTCRWIIKDCGAALDMTLRLLEVEQKNNYTQTHLIAQMQRENHYIHHLTDSYRTGTSPAGWRHKDTGYYVQMPTYSFKIGY